MTVKFEDLIDPTPAGLDDHECCILLEDASVTLLIGLTEIANSEMVESPGMGFHVHNQIPEALPIGKLTEHRRK